MQNDKSIMARNSHVPSDKLWAPSDDDMSLIDKCTTLVGILIMWEARHI